MPKRLPRKIRPRPLCEIQRRAAFRRADRLMDWDLMELFGYEGRHSVLAWQPDRYLEFQNVSRHIDDTPFLFWAVTTGPMVWDHVTRVCRQSGLKISPGHAYLWYPGSRDAGHGSLVTAVLRSTRHAGSGHARLNGKPYPLYMESYLEWGNLKTHESRSLLEKLFGMGATLPAVSPELLFESISRLPLEIHEILESHGLDWSRCRNGVKILAQSMAVSSERVALERIRHLGHQNIGAVFKDPLRNFPDFGYVFVEQTTPRFSGKIAKALLESGFDPHDRVPQTCHIGPYRGRNAWHTLMESLGRGHWRWTQDKPDVLRKMMFLSRQGVDLNLQDGQGRTPFHVYLDNFRGGTIDPVMVDILLRLGADPDIENKAGQSPRSWMQKEALQALTTFEARQTRAALQDSVPQAGPAPVRSPSRRL